MERDLEDLGITISRVNQARKLLKKLAEKKEQGLPLSVFGETYSVALIDPIIKCMKEYDKKEMDVLLKKIKRGIDLNEATELLKEYRKTKMALLWINQWKKIEFAPGDFIPEKCNPGIKRILEDYKKELEERIMGHEK